MATTYGITDAGFVPMQQQDVLADLQAALQAQFGANVNLAAESVLGQLAAVISERHALLWQLAESVHASAFPSGATGTDVDNILALANLKRLPATATRTNPNVSVQGDGVPLYGFVLYGTPGTVVPAGALFDDGAAIPTTFALDAAVTIGAAQNGHQTVYLSNAPTAGAFALTLQDRYGNALSTPSIPYTAQPTSTLLAWPTPPTTGTYQLALGTAVTSAVPAGATAAQLQAAINALSGYGNVAVMGSAAAGFSMVWPAGFVPLVKATGAAAPQVTDAIQGQLNALSDAKAGAQPYTDVLCSPIANGFALQFGAFEPQTGQPSSGSLAQARASVASTTLVAGTEATNITVAQDVVGSPAQGVGSATATKTGASTVKAGALTNIVSAQAGLTGALNQLDCISGYAQEDDAGALLRFNALRSSQGSASLASVVQRVQQVPGVIAALGFQNVTNAAQQVVSFAEPATAGTYRISLGGETTGPIAYNAPASAVQSAVNALPGYAAVKVTGSAAASYVLDFAGANGNQAEPLLTIIGDTTGAGVEASFGRPAHSVEVVVSGGDDEDIAAALLGALPAGIGTYGSPVATTLGSIAANSAQLSVASASNIVVGQSVTMRGLPAGTRVTAIDQTTLTLTAPALGDVANAVATFDYRQVVNDAAGNPQVIGFSRPQQTLLYVRITLVTDTYQTPGQPASGVNSAAKWSPASVGAIQAQLLAIANAIPIGGTVTGRGSDGLIGAFNSTPGVVSYDLAFGLEPGPTSDDNISLGSSQAVSLQAGNIVVSYV